MATGQGSSVLHHVSVSAYPAGSAGLLAAVRGAGALLLVGPGAWDGKPRRSALRSSSTASVLAALAKSARATTCTASVQGIILVPVLMMFCLVDELSIVGVALRGI